jgi:biotin carboxylase
MFVLYKNTGVHSGRALRKMLAELYGEPVRGGYPKRFASVLRAGETPKIVINLGVTDDLPYEGELLNTQDMVRAASNKKKARQIFAEAGVPSPELFLSAKEVSKDDLPVVGRTSYHHKGQGFWFCKTLAQVKQASREGATHFMEFVSNTREYRVHTFIKKKYRESEERTPESYVSIKISEKRWVGEGGPDPLEPQKNHEFGWTFMAPKERREEELDVVRYAAKQAIAALGIDFGAVDVMYRIRAKQPYVLEVNSTPSLSDENATTCEVYANRILKTISADKEE